MADAKATAPVAAEAKRGLFVVIEGLDRSGKTTQCERLMKRLQREKLPVERLRFPDRNTESGKTIHDHLTGKTKIDDAEQLYLLFVKNRREKMDWLRKTLEQGTTVICDRYSYSGVAYATAKGKLTRDWCLHQELGLIAPDVVVYLDIDPDVAEKRIGYGNEVYENPEFQESVRKQYALLWDVVAPSAISLCKITANESIDAIHEKIYANYMYVRSKPCFPISTFEVEVEPAADAVETAKTGPNKHEVFRRRIYRATEAAFARAVWTGTLLVALSVTGAVMPCFVSPNIRDMVCLCAGVLAAGVAERGFMDRLLGDLDWSRAAQRNWNVGVWDAVIETSLGFANAFITLYAKSLWGTEQTLFAGCAVFAMFELDKLVCAAMIVGLAVRAFKLSVH